MRTKVSFCLVLVGLDSPFYSELVFILLDGVIHSTVQKRWGETINFIAIKCGAQTGHGNFTEDDSISSKDSDIRLKGISPGMVIYLSTLLAGLPRCRDWPPLPGVNSHAPAP